MAIPLWAIMAGTSILKNVQQAKQAREQQKRFDQERKAIIKYSPWTGMADPGFRSAGETSPNILASGLQGALMGKMLGQSDAWKNLWANTGSGGRTPAGNMGQWSLMPENQLSLSPEFQM